MRNLKETIYFVEVKAKDWDEWVCCYPEDLLRNSLKRANKEKEELERVHPDAEYRVVAYTRNEV